MNSCKTTIDTYSKKIGKTLFEIVTYTAEDGYSMKELLTKHLENKLNSEISNKKKEESAEKK